MRRDQGKTRHTNPAKKAKELGEGFKKSSFFSSEATLVAYFMEQTWAVALKSTQTKEEEKGGSTTRVAALWMRASPPWRSSSPHTAVALFLLLAFCAGPAACNPDYSLLSGAGSCGTVITDFVTCSAAASTLALPDTTATAASGYLEAGGASRLLPPPQLPPPPTR